MRINGLFGFIFCLCLLIISANSSFAQLADNQIRISEIRVDGNRRVARVRLKLTCLSGTDLTTPYIK